ncbi:hypothetical protein [Pediococcus claussenii]|uniref:Uncharacterized protein n=1 Tax=Pediococcus claussenii (strain ATCC BAA-344 / DSM 14800 / JCM 18046 / KCTC 3811 / LMG 21948 / P06) TaxID=701521 RepID=G8PB62_PEDCP|nr:hypothetical protein [Pediococcus claussenii]AEV94691.1 hypothetical protein PECL_383 [Pediococcus claussenii ATCC BAA-344]ANZ69886.1 hypothetical protein AYR57_05995 [Pediococcus claussenii]ANZ71703.1 hypothetical protein AYR58_06000 [Pediococcus claussenii]KRN20870.1 hypothetical protein IV79_GL000092 [Pediococcus claussenii]
MDNQMAPQIRVVNYDIQLQLGYHQPNIIQLAGITAFDFQGNDISRQLVVDDSQVNYDSQGQYRINIRVQDSHGNQSNTWITAQITNLTNSRLQSQDNLGTAQEQPRATKKKSHWWVVVIALLVIGGVIWAFTNQIHQTNMANDTASSLSSENSSLNSASTSNSNQISELARANKELTNQLSDLKQAVTAYQQSNNRLQFEQQMNELQQKNQSLQNELNQLRQSTQAKQTSKAVAALSESINKISQAQSADEAKQTFDSTNTNNVLNQIKSDLDSIKAKLGF